MTIALGRALSGRPTTAVRLRSAEVPALQSVNAVPRWPLLAAGLLPLVLTCGWSIAGHVQPTSYSPVRQTVSVMAGYGGTDRWIVTAALYAIGLGYFATAAGLRVTGELPRIGLLVSGAAAIAVASFPEPAHGASMPHVLTTCIGAISLAVWPALVARPGSSLRAAVGGRASTIAAAVSLVLFVWTAIETQHGLALGLAERLSSSLQICWPFVVALARSRRRQVFAG